jgi:hypothetical protein
MGRYSRKDMIEFANFAKSYQSPKRVEDAYADYLKGVRLVTTKEESLYQKIRKSNVVYLNGKTIKDRYNEAEVKGFMPLVIEHINNVIIERWNRRTRVLFLKTKQCKTN